MHVLLISQIFRHRKSAAGGKRTLDNRVVRHVKKHYHTLNGARFLKTAAEIIGYIVLHTHRRKHYRKVLPFRIGYLGLTDYLHRKFVVRKTGAGKYRELLPSYQRHKTVYGAYARVDIVTGIGTSHWI